ncbi:zinc metallopeptidase [Paraconexibacter sp.]|uniref:zinc metallopeptidase n=1 Tax=Paraconexibacter sp. TaxID=2949640 RepID=UPI00356A3037
MSGIGMYILFLAPTLILGLAAQWWLKKTFATNAELGVQSGMTGEEVARRILDANGLHGVPVNPSPGGPLSDHYDPRSRGVFLSEPVFAGRSIAAAAVAAHEVGHAIQHDKAYAPMQIRSTMFPAVAFASSTWIFLLMAGAFMNALGLIQVAIALYAIAVLFHFVTLPVEFDASKRAQVQLAGLGLVSDSERTGTRRVLTAAAMTYVVGALAALSQLLYFVLAYLQD